MSGRKAAKEAIAKIEKWTLKSPSRIQSLLSSAVTPGSRAAPTRTSKHDTEVGARLDNGEVYEKDGKLFKAV